MLSKIIGLTKNNYITINMHKISSIHQLAFYLLRPPLVVVEGKTLHSYLAWSCFFHKLLFIIINYIFLLYYLYQLTKFQYQIFTSQDIKHFRFSKNLQFRHMMTPSASFSYKFDNGTTFWCSFSAYFFLENFHDLPGN